MINWERVYREAIEYMGGEKTAGLSMPELKQAWKAIRKQQKAEGLELPRVQTVYKVAEEQGFEFDYEYTDRDENMNTLPPAEPLNLGGEYIEAFKRNLESIYTDTINYTQSWHNKSLDSTERQAAYIASLYVDQLTSVYDQILALLDWMVATYGEEVVGNMIASDIELDYTIAIVFIPPSEVDIVMEMTLEQLRGIMDRIVSTNV